MGIAVAAAHALARTLLTWYLMSFVLKIVVARRNAPWKRGSAASVATSFRDWRSLLHSSHSLCRISYGLFFNRSNSWQFAFRHAKCCWHQLPGTDVALPCKKAWLLPLNLPSRNSACTLASHSSAVRSHCVNSVTPCIPSCFVPHIRFWPCNARGVFATLNAAERRKVCIWDLCPKSLSTHFSTTNERHICHHLPCPPPYRHQCNRCRSCPWPQREMHFV